MLVCSLFCHVCSNIMLNRVSEERSLGFALKISKNLQGVDVLVEDKGEDGAVMTSFL